MENKGSANNLLRLWGLVFTAAGIFIIYAALSGQINSSSEAINNSPLLGILAGLLFISPGVWALQLPIWNQIKFPGNQEARTMLAMGIIALLIGVFLILMSAFDDEANFNAPRWVAGLASSVFALAGIFMIKTALFDQGAQNNNSLFNAVLLGILLSCFGIVVTWISLGAGERELSGSVSIPFITLSSEASETLGRLCFMPGALLLDFMAALTWLHVLKRLTQVIKEGSDEPAEIRRNALIGVGIILMVSVIGVAVAGINYLQYLNRPR